MRPSAPAPTATSSKAHAVPLCEFARAEADTSRRPGTGSARGRCARAPRARPGTGRTGPSFDASLTTRSSPSSRCTSSTGFPGSYGTSSASAGRKKLSAISATARAASARTIPAPGQVAFPGVSENWACSLSRSCCSRPSAIPLHIFEPRYKELIGECIADEREFGLVLADEDGRRDDRHARRRRRGAPGLRRRPAQRARRGPRAVPASSRRRTAARPGPATSSRSRTSRSPAPTDDDRPRARGASGGSSS